MIFVHLLNRGRIMIYQVKVKEKIPHYNTLTHRYDYWFELAYYSFQENSTIKYNSDSISVQNGQYISSEKGIECSVFRLYDSAWDSAWSFPSRYWKDICFETQYDASSGYTTLRNRGILQDSCIYVSSKDCKDILSFYDIRNNKRKIEKKSIPSFITKETLSIAENLILNFVDDELFISRILNHLNAYSSETINSEWSSKRLAKDVSRIKYLKGKKKRI